MVREVGFEPVWRGRESLRRSLCVQVVHRGKHPRVVLLVNFWHPVWWTLLSTLWKRVASLVCMCV